MTSFKDSQEAAFRRIVRAAVRSGPFSKSEQDVVMAFMNHWLHHRNSIKGCVHPGRERIAKKARVSIKTVQRTFAMLRDHGAIVAVGHLNGLQGKATEYEVDLDAFYALSRKSKDDLALIGGTNVPFSSGTKCPAVLDNILPFPSQKVGTLTKGVA